MTKKLLLWTGIPTAVVMLALGWIHHRYVLNSGELEEAITRELPTGASKAAVIEFVQHRRPLFWDYLGSQVKARLSGLAENMVYQKDVVLTFEFNSDGKLKSYSKKEYLTFF
jgi:hypothetical protein